MLVVGVEDQVAQPVLGAPVEERPEEREAPPLAVHRVLAGRERDVAAVAVAPLPHREPNELQAVERALVEVQFGVGQLAGRVAPVVAADLDEHVLPPCWRPRLSPLEYAGNLVVSRALAVRRDRAGQESKRRSRRAGSGPAR